MEKIRKGRSRNATGRAFRDVEVELEHLAGCGLTKSRKEWERRFGSKAPRVQSRDILLRLLAWQIQADAFGGLDHDSERKLRTVAAALERDGNYEPQIRRDLSPGVVLTREWKGTLYKVTVTTGGFRLLDQEYNSLSDIARTITGTRWSGPRFFGLEQKAARKTEKAVS